MIIRYEHIVNNDPVVENTMHFQAKELVFEESVVFRGGYDTSCEGDMIIRGNLYVFGKFTVFGDVNFAGGTANQQGTSMELSAKARGKRAALR